MAEANCVTHSDRQAVGYCSRCQKPYCPDCLDVEMGQPICAGCKKRSEAGAPVPSAPSLGAGPSPLNFKGKGMDDDPLGLFGTSGPTKPTLPKLDPPRPGPAPSMAPPLNLGAPAMTPTPPPSIPPPPSKSGPDLDSLASPPPMTSPFSSPPEGSLPPMSYPLGSISGVETPKRNKFVSLTKTWTKYLMRRSYDVFDPLANKLRVPTFVVILLLAGMTVAAIMGLGILLKPPSVKLVDSVAPFHLIQVNAGQVSEMDVVSYAELQGKLQGMGFTPMIQMTIPELPSPNFFDVGVKDDVGIYGEILKFPGQITPRLSFVTVFTNGVWFSSNAWPGESHELEYLISEFRPNEAPDQLYVGHFQMVEKLKQERGWQVQSMNVNRYTAALSDHVRWFLDKEGLQGYQASFEKWH